MLYQKGTALTERRESDRRRTYLCGRITFNDRVSTMDCLIRNLSRNGAMLEFPGPVKAAGAAWSGTTASAPASRPTRSISARSSRSKPPA